MNDIRRRPHSGPGLALALALTFAAGAIGTGGAGAQEAVPPVPAADPAPPARPGDAGPPAAPGEEVIAWYRAPFRCAYFAPEDALRFQPDRPETWRFRFLVLAATAARPAESAGQAERGYVMKDGLLRELEKVRSGPDAEGASVTVWRSAGEPRLNITTTLRPDGEERGVPRLRGTLATMRGDGRDTTDITGTCGD